MKRIARLAVVIAATAAVTSLPLPSAAQDQVPPGTIKVTRLAHTKAYIVDMVGCLRGDESWERYSTCQQRYPLARYGHCLQLEHHYADGTMRVIHRDAC